MTELSFSIRFPRFSTTAQRVILKPGVNVIYGESGVGKSHLCQVLAGFRQSRNLANFVLSQVSSARQAMMVTQNPDDQIVAPTIFGELAFNLENLGWHSSRINSEIRTVTRLLDVDWALSRHPATLSGGEREILNIATALSVSPDVLLIDDGLAFLSEANRTRIVQILADYCLSRGAVVLWTTSDILDVERGAKSWQLQLDGLSTQVDDRTEGDFHWQPYSGNVTLVAKNLTFRYAGFEPLFCEQNFTVGPFRALALLGENGSGKSTLARLLAGLIEPERGKVFLRERRGRKLKICFLPQFPERLLGGRTFEEILAELQQNGLFRESNMLLLVRALREFQIAWDLMCAKPINTLKLSVIRVTLVLMMVFANYDFLILDEPLFSLGARQRRRLMRFLATSLNRKHLLIISHSDLMVTQLCDTAVRIIDGEIIHPHVGRGAYAAD